MEIKKGVYTLGDFVTAINRECNKRLTAKHSINIQSDEALELLNRCLPRNLLVSRLFLEDEEGVSILDIKNE